MSIIRSNLSIKVWIKILTVGSDISDKTSHSCVSSKPYMSATKKPRILQLRLVSLNLLPWQSLHFTSFMRFCNFFFVCRFYHFYPYTTVFLNYTIKLYFTSFSSVLVSSWILCVLVTYFKFSSLKSITAINALLSKHLYFLLF